MMTATSTDADANTPPGAEQEERLQRHTQPSQPTTSQPGTPIPMMDLTKTGAGTGAATATATATATQVEAQTQQETDEQGQDQGQDTDVTSMIAREGSELAQRLRESGWIARAGWRSSDATGRPVWHLRFEQPSTAFNS